ncbi:SLC13 family permease [Salinicola sp. LHM]|uniref:SLC13 family permease n=1 Tax=Salinicola sp. LHM TaxID=3065298 RepID=UPI002ACD9DE9|nr:SLC13 family permease [Salinicola sp. LHM]WQH33690.1 SLC13 family permease [Salinicola sp. LHM]
MAIIIILVTLGVFILDRITISITAMISALAFYLLGTTDYQSVYSGFSSTVVMLVFGMMIVGDALFQTGLVLFLGRKITRSRFAKNELTLMIILMIMAGLVSAFLSNTATMATLIPLIAAIAAKSNGVIKTKNLLMPIAMAASIGGTLTLVGSTPQPLVNGVLSQYDYPPIGLFDFAILAGPCFLLMMAYMITIGYKVQHSSYNFSAPELTDSTMPDEIQLTLKTWISGATMLFCIISFVTGLFPIGIIAIIGAAIVLVTRCVDFKPCMQRVDWNTILLLVFAQGIAAGMNNSGAGKMIADMTAGVIGNDFWILFCACIVVTVVLTNLMSNTATAAMMAPIFIQIADSLGYNPYPFALGIAVASNIAIATPIGAVAMSQVLVGGYRFRDYLVNGLPLTIAMTLLICIWGPLVLSSH